jgi:hypothetical protein
MSNEPGMYFFLVSLLRLTVNTTKFDKTIFSRFFMATYKKINKVGALVRQRTIPTERPPLVGEVSANFSG